MTPTENDARTDTDALAAAEKWLREGHRTRAAIQLVLAEYDRRSAELERFREKLTAIHAMLPRLREYLPADLFAELGAHIYVLPFHPPTEADQRRALEIAKRAGLA